MFSFDNVEINVRGYLAKVNNIEFPVHVEKKSGEKDLLCMYICENEVYP